MACIETFSWNRHCERGRKEEDQNKRECKPKCIWKEEREREFETKKKVKIKLLYKDGFKHENATKQKAKCHRNLIQAN